MQNFVITNDINSFRIGAITFKNSATAGNLTSFNNLGALLVFRNTSTAANATITNTGVNDVVGATSFGDNSSAGNATITKTSPAKTNMKTTSLILLATISIANANLIDLTPGGFNVYDGLPQAFIHTIVDQQARGQITFFDSVTPDGWVSIFGHLNGGTNFFTSLIGNPGPTANVSWDFKTLPGYSMSVLLVEGLGGWDNLYAVPRGFRFVDLNDEITLHGTLPITSLAFYGRTPSSPVPDTGSTLALMSIGLLGMFVYARRVRVNHLSRLCEQHQIAHFLVSLGRKSLTVGSNDLDTAFAGAIQDGGQNGGTGGSLTKIGTGTLILSGANSYTGDTNINHGVLQVDGSITSNTFVRHRSTVAGTGTINANLTNVGGTVRPGGTIGAPGVLTVQDYTQDKYTQLMIQIAGMNPGEFSVLSVLGTTNLSGYLKPRPAQRFCPDRR